jgi:acetyl-CoA carboxylase biotin carboxyl carrier protein
MAARANGRDQRWQPARAVAQVAVAEDEDRRLGRQRQRQHAPRGQRVRAALADVARRCHDLGAGGARAGRGVVGGGVVGDEHARAREGLAQRCERLLDAVALVVGGDDHDDGGDVHGRGYRASPRPQTTPGGSVPDIEAHITGTVWKIECKVGDEISEGDTVVILESMKMEMPVEAEDEGVVKEILCEEGQAVNEGDTLVVLE